MQGGAGSKIAAFFMLALGAAMLADVLIHPTGTKAAGNAVAGILTPVFSSAIGGGQKSQ